ncbi:hypothetical protein AB0L99_35395 [Streptomyces sp. NPDC051954]|uniref:hypothetical protein n=1 Tax=unclassified Streptomyces TaxID=2593676 RepID=UPI00344812FC
MASHVLTPPPCSDPFEPRLRAVRTLLLAGHPHRAADHCAWLRTRAARTGAHRWQAAFGALRAEALLCLGDLAAAEREAATAVQVADGDTPLRLWPVAALAEALTELGHHDEADRRLRRAAPGPLPLTEDVLPYLRARSRHFLAVRCPEEALAGALRAGELTARQKGGLFAELPWRTDAAQALLHLGRPDRAAELIDAQLTEATLGPRHRGIALRLRAAVEAPARRPATLALAATELRTAGDRPEQARVLADMADALRALGDDSTSEAVLHRAWSLAAACGAAPLCERLLPTTVA